MALADVTDWLDHLARPDTVWFAKRLAANDTLANHSHQAGPYIPKAFLFNVFPALNRIDAKNPDRHFDLYLDSHADHRRVRGIYYNNKFHDNRTGGRDETRITGFGGGRSPLLDPESTGALAAFVFIRGEDGNATECHVWLSRHPTEEDLIEDRVGPVDPGKFVVWTPGQGVQGDLLSPRPRTTCRLAPNEIPPDWLRDFPTGEAIIRKAVELRMDSGADPDIRLIRRRDCEYELFQSLEEAFFLPRIHRGFETVESFVALAQSVLQSRKSRSGNSLELHAREIFIEEGLTAGSDFDHRPIVEGGKRPDFVFPSSAAYANPAFPASNLRMLAAKTTVKDRWRQILSEADRIGTKHLLTLQEGVSEPQFREMTESNVQLVVPRGLHQAYPEAVRPHLMSVESFLADVRLLGL